MALDLRRPRVALTVPLLAPAKIKVKKQPIRKGVKNTRTGTLDELNRRDLLSDLINGESNGLHVLSFSPLLPAVLLHQRHQEAAI